ncbi:MAG: DUF6125 family protein [bacterium]
MKATKKELEDIRPQFRAGAREFFDRMSGAEREALMIRCWMAHDARWFMAIARECGMEFTNRINQEAAREIGRFEARRIQRALRLRPVKTLEGYLQFQERIIELLGPELLQYEITRADGDAFHLHISYCFAAENAIKGGIADSYECGILPRVLGWLDSLRIGSRLEPALGRCMKCAGTDCVFTIGLDFAAR